jgi:hypothetical protein
MIGRRENGQGHLFYSFDLDEVVPPDHLVRQLVERIEAHRVRALHGLGRLQSALPLGIHRSARA